MGAGVGEGLSIPQERLEVHFAALRAERDEEAGPAFPIFALEHDLGETEFGWLKTAVRDAVRRRHLPAGASLPFVVYAAEVGYDYAGEEFWQTFSARTPGWSDMPQATIDYATPNYIGLRTPDALIRFYGRAALGMTVAVSHHEYREVDAPRVKQAWESWLADALNSATT